jgi:hypothetical protein
VQPDDRDVVGAADISALTDELDRCRAQIHTLVGECEALRQECAEAFAARRAAEWAAHLAREELEELYATRTMRWSELPRRWYARLRRW